MCNKMQRNYTSILFYTIFFLLSTATCQTFAFTQSCVTPNEQNSSSTTLLFTNRQSTIANKLGWVTDPSSFNLCQGYYLEPAPISTNKLVDLNSKFPVTITAKQPALFAKYGVSILQGNVTITQPGRTLVADKITLYRDDRSKQINTCSLFGNVYLQEYGRLIIAENGRVDFVNNTMTLNNTIYRLITPSAAGPLHAWGVAKKIERDNLGLIKLHEASYSTCPPNKNTWKLWNKNLVLNKKTGRGTAVNTILYANDIPVLYMPYFSFSIDKNRKTGFLYPNFTYASTNGLNLIVPYYLNLAPNYDAIITPQLISKRGIATNGLFRYLIPHNNGSLDVTYIPHDSFFAKFRDNAKYKYQPSNTLTELQNSNLDRGMLNFLNNATYNQNWSSTIQVNYVTDDYFLQDFGASPSVIDNDQLLNQVDINYDNQNWHFLGRIQAFQTLHPITQATSIKNQYRRLPQLNLDGTLLPNNNLGLNSYINTEFVNFQHSRDFNTGNLVPIGNRFYISPNISLPINYGNSYTLPKLSLAGTFYSLHNQPDNYTNNISRFVPLFSLDSNLLFNRNTTLFDTSYIQTLEPKLFYLFVPKVNQDNIPLFDTTLPTFNYEQLFRNNRFSGIDRIGDANQITLAITSRFLDSSSGQEKLHTSIGQVFLLHKHEITLADKKFIDSLATNYFSPIVGEVQYTINPKWNISANIAWEPNSHNINNSSLNLQYIQPKQNIVNISYNFVNHGDYNIDTIKNLESIDLSAAITLKQSWNIIGDWNYNMSSHHPQAYFYGFEYESCCFALRILKSKTFTGQDTNWRNNFSDTFYLQFLLKGLGNIGNSDASALVASRIPGYQDNLATGIKL
jgi:LPS-assembly protein